MNPFTVASAGLSAGDSRERGLLHAYLKSREAAYNDEPIVGNAFDFVIADAKTLLGASWATTYILQTFGNQRVYQS